MGQGRTDIAAAPDCARSVCAILAEALEEMDPEAMATAADALTRIAAAVERSQSERRSRSLS